MSKKLAVPSEEARHALTSLFEKSSPVLAEVRFPNMGTSPDWYFCQEEEELEQILDRLAPGVELHVSSVSDLKNAIGEIRLKKTAT